MSACLSCFFAENIFFFVFVSNARAQNDDGLHTAYSGNWLRRGIFFCAWVLLDIQSFYKTENNLGLSGKQIHRPKFLIIKEKRTQSSVSRGKGCVCEL